MTKINIHLKKIEKLRERYYKALPGKEQLIKIIGEIEVAEHVYNSNAIENSTLTLEETEKILMQIKLDRYLEEREIYEAKNLARVVEYVDNNAKDKELDNDIVLFLHKMLISNINNGIAGRFRNLDEYVRVGQYHAPAPTEVGSRLFAMFLEYRSGQEENIIKKIAKFHLTFENIHPFVDGNGRIGRVLNNYLLIREGYVPVNIKFFDRQHYYDAFKEFDKEKKTDIMNQIVGIALLNSYHKRLAYMENKKIITLNKFFKDEKLNIKKDSYSNLLNKAERQTIEAFLDKGVWKIGN